MTAKQTAAAKPAFDFDMFKSFGQFKAPGFDFEAMMATQRKNMEAATAANQRAFEGMNAMMSRQAEVVRESTESAMKVASDLAAGPNGGPCALGPPASDLVAGPLTCALHSHR